MRRMIVAVAVGAMALAGFPAGGHEVVKQDPNDTPGKFDIRWVSMDHTGKTPRRVVLKTKVTGQLQEENFTGDNRFVWKLDVSGERYTVELYAADDHQGGLEMHCRTTYDEEEVIVGADFGSIGEHVGRCKPTRSIFGGENPDRFRGKTIRGGTVDTTGWRSHGA
jgi:hypothetical protein